MLQLAPAKQNDNPNPQLAKKLKTQLNSEIKLQPHLKEMTEKVKLTSKI